MRELLSEGTIYWLTGLAGAGKTTVGRLLYERLRRTKENVIFLDGDTLREVFGDDLGYTLDDRLRCAMRYARICQMLSMQGMDVICCTISMFDDVRAWNRKHIAMYKEIYLRVDKGTLHQRNQKGLYESSADSLVGFGVAMEEPKHSDLVIDNNGELTPEEIVQKIWEEIVK